MRQPTKKAALRRSIWRGAALFVASLATGLAGGRVATAKDGDEGDKAYLDRAHIDVVFAIDCSGSMGPVIETAKQKVWAIVNQVAKAKPVPILRIGLLGYGDANRQYRTFALSDDLDEVYKNLMHFHDEGWSEEYVGLAVRKAHTEMGWSPSPKALKIIYVVGNETARQGPLEADYAVTAPAASRAGILVNAIYCGDADYAQATPTWRQMAQLAGGSYNEIAATGGGVTILTPLDKEMAELSALINKTYVAYGRLGSYGAANQAAQDANADKAGGAATVASRAASKSAAQYNNRNWDLVDACREPNFDWSKVNAEDLPAEMRPMTPAERKAYVERKAAERALIQARIKEMAARRDAYIEEEMKKRGLSGDKALDEAIRRTIVEQARQKGFTFEK